MNELFPDGPVYEYSQLVNIIYSFAWAFILSSIIAITHRLTFSGDRYPGNFFQSLILGTVVSTMVMMAIGDSLARGLGVFGAMAIIRFRTRVDDPRDVLFLFAALSTGLAIGVYGFTVSFVGALLFCGVAVLLHLSPFRSFVQQHVLVFVLTDGKDLEQVLQVLNQYCLEHRQLAISLTRENEVRYKYGLSLKSDADKNSLVEALRMVTGLRQLRVALNEPDDL